MGNQGKYKMFTAERLAQVFLAIILVATILVLALKKPSVSKFEETQPHIISADTVKTVSHADSSTAIIAKPPSKKKKKQKQSKKKMRKNERKNKAVRQRDHLHEPMTAD